MQTKDEVLFEIHNRIACVTLNRPQALNALSHDMVKVLQKCFNECAVNPEIHAVLIEGNGKAFCAGGDIRAIYKHLLHNDAPPIDFFIDEYQLDLKIHRYPKPVIALMHGYTMGGGMGLAQGARYRIISDTGSMAMPETAIGFFPDVGGSYFLSRCPGAFGLYMGITGAQINSEEALYGGLADYVIKASQFLEFKNLLFSLAWTDDHIKDIESTIDKLDAVTANQLPRLPIIELVDKHFSKASIRDIVLSLQREDNSQHKEWTDKVLNLISTRSPLSMCVTYEEISRGKNLSLEKCFHMELNMLYACFERSDFKEGVRALLIDKDQQPKWNAASIEEIKPSDIKAFFEET